jgi:nucleoside-diphosphate-sugar epimerase
MNIAVFGATGLTGGLVAERALAAGHRVAALVRTPDAVRRQHEQLTVLDSAESDGRGGRGGRRARGGRRDSLPRRGRQGHRQTHVRQTPSISN